MVEMGWEIVQPLLESWSAQPASELPGYAAGSWGPRESDELLARENRRWRAIED